MKNIIIIVLLLFYGVSYGQAPVFVGSLDSTDLNVVKGRFGVRQLKDTDSSRVLATDANGNFYLRVFQPIDITGIRDTTNALYDSLQTHWAVIWSNTVAVLGKISYADTGIYLATRSFVLTNYFANGGNSFGVAWSLGSISSVAGRIIIANANIMDFFVGGNVGIGTNGVNSGYRLEVIGTGRYSGALTVGSTITATGAFYLGANSTMIKRNHDYGSGVLSGMHYGAIEGGGGGWSLYFSSVSGGWNMAHHSSGTVFTDIPRTTSVTSVKGTNALVDHISTTRCVYPTRMTLAQRNAMTGVTFGAEFYCIDCIATDGSTGVKQTYNGTTWKNNW